MLLINKLLKTKQNVGNLPVGPLLLPCQENIILIFVFFIPLLFFIVLPTLKVSLNNIILLRKTSQTWPCQKIVVKSLIYEGSVEDIS